MAVGNRIIFVTPNSYFGVGDTPAGPTPDMARLDPGKNYLVLSLENNCDTDECEIALVNDFGEIWFISNRHLRVTSIYQDDKLIYSFMEDQHD
jgi:hypothetical protein